MKDEHFSFRWGIDILDCGYTTIPNWILDHYHEVDVSYKEFALIVHLARYAFESPEGECRPSVKAVATAMGIHPRSVQRSLADLEDRGLLTRRYRLGKPTIYDFKGFSKAVFRVAYAAETPPEDDGDDGEGGDENVRGDKNVTPDENVTPDKNVTGGGDKNVMGGVTKMSPEEQKKEKEIIRTTAARAHESDNENQHQSDNESTDVDVAGAVSFKSFSKKDTHPLPEELATALNDLGFRGQRNYAEVTSAYQRDPDYVRGWIEALDKKQVTADRPAALLLTAIREEYPLPKPAPQEEIYGPPNPDCDQCLGTGTPLVDGHWQRGEHCMCTQIPSQPEGISRSQIP
jgi:hypothetical protein